MQISCFVYTVIIHVPLWLQVCSTVSGQSYPTKGIPCSITHRLMATVSLSQNISAILTYTTYVLFLIHSWWYRYVKRLKTSNMPTNILSLLPRLAEISCANSTSQQNYYTLRYTTKLCSFGQTWFNLQSITSFIPIPFSLTSQSPCANRQDAPPHQAQQLCHQFHIQAPAWNPAAITAIHHQQLLHKPDGSLHEMESCVRLSYPCQCEPIKQVHTHTLHYTKNL